jgi:predicted GH43/DUF377 family glycosyl hydrolase
MTRRDLLATSLLLAGCRRYGDFTLPVSSGGPPAATYTWQPAIGPILGPGDWDSRDVLNPSVVASPALLNFYSGFDGQTWRTGLAASSDGLRWRKLGMVLAPDPATWEGSYMAANGSALYLEGQFWYWYQAGPAGHHRIGLARSRDGHTWQKEPAPVLDTGPYAAWDERAVADPYVIRLEPYFYMFYLGQDRARPPRQRLGLARSRDGVSWRKLRSNPLLELGEPGAFDENGLGEPAVWSARGFYWMLYTGRDAGESRRLGLARSTDGVLWRKLPDVFSGAEPWNQKVLCDPTVLTDGPRIRVWFGGGDLAHTDENIHGQIGFAILQPK